MSPWLVIVEVHRYRKRHAKSAEAYTTRKFMGLTPVHIQTSRPVNLSRGKTDGYEAIRGFTRNYRWTGTMLDGG